MGQVEQMKHSVVAEAPAKLNLAFNVGVKRPDGYHEIDSVMQSVDLYDTITLSRISGKGIYISCDKARIPCDENNLAHIAARAFYKAFGIQEEGALLINIEKRIPMLAGLGGGSADAAGVLVGMNTMYEQYATREQLCEIGATVGADVPFCILGSTMRVRGIGDKLSVLPPMPSCSIVLAKPDIGVSTKKAFALYDALPPQTPADITGMLRWLDCGNLRRLAGSVGNVMEQAVNVPAVFAIKARMLEMGAMGTAMSGSGSTVYGIFDNKTLAKRCMHKLFEIAESAFVVRPSPRGAVVIYTQEDDL